MKHLKLIDLPTLFDVPPIYQDIESGIYSYEKTNIYGFKLYFYLEWYDQIINVCLRDERFTNPLFDFSFHGAYPTYRDDSKLVIKLLGNKNGIIHLKSSFGISFERSND